MTVEVGGETPESLFEDAPCGYISTLPDGTIVVANRTFEVLTGLARDELVGKRKLQDLLPRAGRIYHETHYRPLLLLRGEAREIALEIERADGSRVPVLLNSTVSVDDDGSPRTIRTIVFPAAERRSYEEELLLARRRDHEVALQLQRSFLAGAVTGGPGLELEVAYRPGVSGLESSGDWYDAFWLVEDETIALVVGDVVGRGVAAATVMAQLRSATRALATTGISPCRLLQALDRYTTVYGTGDMTTLVYAELTLPTRTIRFSRAGHPPLLVAPPGDEPFFALDAHALPLAAVTGTAVRDDTTLELEPGTVLVLYTDGLVERRSRSIDVGMESLRRTIAESTDTSPKALVERVMSTMENPDSTDDVCLIVARIAQRDVAPPTPS